MKKPKLLAAALASTMFATSAFGLVACDKDAVDDLMQQYNPTGSTYTVSFNAGTGTLNGAATLKTNKEGIVQGDIPTATPASTDYTFLGWSLTSGATTDAAKINFTTHKFTKDTPVYAIYKAQGGENSDEYTIEFDYGDGTGTVTSATTVNKKLTSLPDATPNDSDYMFDGWYTQPDGEGNLVTTNTVFSDDGTIYANYRIEGEEVEEFFIGDYYIFGTFNDWVCGFEHHIGWSSGSVTLYLEANTEFKLVKCKNDSGEPDWNGSDKGVGSVAGGKGYVEVGENGNIMIKLSGTYTISLVSGQIEISSEDVEEPEVTIAEAIPGDYYVVGGEGFGGWGSCLAKYHVGTDSGEITITVKANTEIKLAKANSTGGIEWDGSELGTKKVTVGNELIKPDKDNITFISAGTYIIKLVSGSVEIYVDGELPEPSIEIDGYTYGAIGASGYYLVGAFMDNAYDANTGYGMLESTSSVTNAKEYKVEGFTVRAGAAIKIRNGSGDSVGFGYSIIDDQWGNKDWVETDSDGNIVFKQGGTYNIYFNPTEGKIYLSK
ncbi:MAG: InlB B-repeat-containing protein [Clostridiales bacterium]|nr:InlB B-repeat-containing protein [Clostridiales bacterium]